MPLSTRKSTSRFCLSSCLDRKMSLGSPFPSQWAGAGSCRWLTRGSRSSTSRTARPMRSGN